MGPSWYVYGWPICFATSGRGRFNFYLGFEVTALILDLVFSLLLVVCTAFAVESLLRRFPTVKVIDLLAIGAGLYVSVFVLSGGLHKPLELIFGAVPPVPNYSAVPGDVRLASRLPVLVTAPLAFGLAAVGFAIVSLSFRRSLRR